DIADRDGVAGGAREGERAVLVHGLGGGHAVDRRVVHGVDGDGDRVGVAERAAGAGVALVVGGDREVGAAVVVGGRVEGQTVEGGVDVGEAAGDDDRAGAVAGDGEARGARQVEDAVGDGQRHLHAGAAGVDVADRDRIAGGRAERQRPVLVH